MLKKILTLFFIISTALIAQDFEGARIYINPGHGGHDSNDRYIAATGFWESDGNLAKGLYLKEILDSLNATTKISRTLNRTQDDLGLSVIVADANNFSADYFHSIHSNGWRGDRNYTLMLFQGGDNSPTFAGAKEMGGYMADEIYKAHRTTAKHNRGDADFYGTGEPYLGVLKGLTMPGTLSEGSFHDYIPESWRLRSEGYLKHEAWALTKSFVRYFGLTPLPFGEIAGVLRDPFDQVRYNYITSADSKVPLNLVKATLIPGNKTYNGDFFNNGFFLLDEITPGTYDVILEAENYETDTVTVTVSASKTSFADKFLIPKPNYSVPVIESSSPTNIVDVRLDSKFVFVFNVKMDKNAVQNAFSIMPATAGSFTWEQNDKWMTFTPTNFLAGGTDYQLLISTDAKSYTDVAMTESYSYSFATRSSLKLVKSYPTDGLENVSTTIKIKASFDAPIDQSSLSGKVIFEDANGTSVPLYIDEVDYANGWIIFEPRDPLITNSNYVVKFLSGIKDVEGSNLSDDVILNFKTEHTIIKEGTIINDFEEIGNWWQPHQSGSTVGVDTDNSTFTISTKRNISGENSGRLGYIFTSDSNGVCRIYNSDEPIVSSSNNLFGSWVFGDFSSNILEYWFRDGEGTNIPIIIDTLNWTGWQFKELDLSAYNNLKFHSYVIKQNPNGENKGQIYFDGIITNVITDLEEENNYIPTEYKLEQNYPNPFNPSTIIKYNIPNVKQLTETNRNVTLKVYDILGREVSTLVNKIQAPGIYSITFDASSLSSGVYYYRLKSGDYLETKKMILLW
ncbi:MAG: T9SS type A sorting domain-containing protein [Ignavibacteriae bacterium]|nr:T9SS type A sorting domain-containing protein [Ignavibacteriota bacterium]